MALEALREEDPHREAQALCGRVLASASPGSPLADAERLPEDLRVDDFNALLANLRACARPVSLVFRRPRAPAAGRPRWEVRGSPVELQRFEPPSPMPARWEVPREVGV